MAQPIAVEPSQAWQGNDGPWSTFVLRVGTPVQLVWVLASTTVPETWIVDKAGCIKSDPSGCPDSRGKTFNTNASSTWKDAGFYEFGVELNLPYTGNYDSGDYGFDTMGVGYPGGSGSNTTLDRQVVATFATKDFYLGNLGLTPRSINLTGVADGYPSYLSNLKEANMIPSLSFGYNAGAQYRLKKATGSLTLGGYDSSRFTPNDVIFNFASDISRDLVVGLQSIQFSDSQTQNKELLPSGGILTFIDSTVPHLWLPLDACQAFEDAFGITYDNETDLYLVNNTLHNTLREQSANVSFIIGNAISGGPTVSITFPYASFDLQVEYPIVNTSTHYFPIRRAANDSQYTLGRTFLQESFLTVDYERSTFQVQEARWEENASQNLVPILTENASTPQQSGDPTPSKLSTGATAGIAVGAAVIALLIVGAWVFWFIRRRRRRSHKESEIHNGNEIDDHSHEKPGELAGESKRPDELAGDDEFYSPHFKKDPEMEGSPGPVTNRAEVPGSHGGAEMEGTQGGVEIEGDIVPEMVGEGSPQIYELPAGEYLDPRTSRASSNRSERRNGRDRPTERGTRSWRRSRQSS